MSPVSSTALQCPPHTDPSPRAYREKQGSQPSRIRPSLGVKTHGQDSQLSTSQGRVCQEGESTSLALALPHKSRWARKTGRGGVRHRSHPSHPAAHKHGRLAHPAASRMDSNRTWTTDLSKRPLNQHQGLWSEENPMLKGLRPLSPQALFEVLAHATFDVSANSAASPNSQPAEFPALHLCCLSPWQGPGRHPQSDPIRLSWAHQARGTETCQVHTASISHCPQTPTSTQLALLADTTAGRGALDWQSLACGPGYSESQASTRNTKVSPSPGECGQA